MEGVGIVRNIAIFLIAVSITVHTSCAQNPLRGTMITVLGDVASIKQTAEAGDAQSQVSLGDSLASNFRSIDALDWYRKAARQGNVEGAAHAGHLLLFGGPGIPKEQIVQAKPFEGIPLIFQAATNQYPDALRDMSHAYQQALGVSTNWVQAYAWMQLYSETPPGSIVGKVELNQMALKLDTPILQQAQQLATEFKHGHWIQPVAQVAPKSRTLKLSSIIFGSPPLATINGHTFGEGESQNIKISPQESVSLKCIKIEKDSVLVSVDGETAPRRLSVK